MLLASALNDLPPDRHSSGLVQIILLAGFIVGVTILGIYVFIKEKDEERRHKIWDMYADGTDWTLERDVPAPDTWCDEFRDRYETRPRVHLDGVTVPLRLMHTIGGHRVVAAECRIVMTRQFILRKHTIVQLWTVFALDLADRVVLDVTRTRLTPETIGPGVDRLLALASNDIGHRRG